ncbi:hypothetical protein [Oricola sp.]|uniref:hypothetical protein n=1 Tax=Oricola sp. TaxID=1979950 RepID=UPI003BAC1ECE
MADNLSMNGMDALMHDTSGHAVGNHVEVFNDKLGYVAGYVRSVRTRRIGIEFDTNTNNYAKIAAFFRNYRG